MMPFEVMRHTPVVAPVAGISFVGVSSGSVGVSSTPTVDLTALGGSLAQGDLVVILWVGTSTVDLTITPPTGWSSREDLYSNGTSQDTNVGIFYKFMGSTPDTSVSLPASEASGSAAWCCMAFRGVNAATPFDVADTTASNINASAPDPPAITPATAGAWIIACAGRASASSGLLTNSGGDLIHFVSANNGTATRKASAGMGVKSDWTSGAFDPAAFGGGGTLAAGNSSASVTMAVRPA